MSECVLTLESEERGIMVRLNTARNSPDGEVTARVPARHQILQTIDRMLRKARVPLSKLTRIETKLSGGTFSETRAAVTTANALGYALGIPPAPHFISASYRGEPSISKPKKA